MTLVIKNDGIGDLVLASGLIADLAAAKGPLDLVTCEANREIAENIPGVRRCYYVSRDSLRFRRYLWRAGCALVHGAREDHQVLRELRRQTYEDALCLRRFIRQSSLAVMTRVRARRRHCAWLYPTNAPARLARLFSKGWRRYEGSETGSELTYFRDFVRGAVGLDSTSPPRLRCAEGVVARPEPGRVGLVISGVSTHWPVEHWEALTASLVASGCRCVLFGGADAMPLAARLRERFDGVESWVGTATFSASVSELARLALLIGNDTGMTHFGSLVAARVLVVLGGGTFGRFFPWPGQDRQTVVFRAMECFDCDWQCRYAERECMNQVKPGEVLKIAQRLLGGERMERQVNLTTEAVVYQPGWRRVSSDSVAAAPGLVIPGGAARS